MRKPDMKKNLLFIGVVLALLLIPTVALALEFIMTIEAPEIAVGATTTVSYNMNFTQCDNYEEYSDFSATYSSSDTAVATVDGTGKVTGVSPGVAQIIMNVIYYRNNIGSQLFGCENHKDERRASESITVTVVEPTSPPQPSDLTSMPDPILASNPALTPSPAPTPNLTRTPSPTHTPNPTHTPSPTPTPTLVPVPPIISGPGTINLTEGYKDFSQAYKFTGAPSPTRGISPKLKNTANATFSENTLTIPAGLKAAGSPYIVTIFARNEAGMVTKTITVIVSPKPIQ